MSSATVYTETHTDGQRILTLHTGQDEVLTLSKVNIF